MFIICYINVRVLKLRFLAFSQGPGGFRELREAYRNHFHLSWYLSDYVVTSYEQKPWGGIFFTVHGLWLTCCKFHLDLESSSQALKITGRPLKFQIASTTTRATLESVRSKYCLILACCLSCITCMSSTC